MHSKQVRYLPTYLTVHSQLETWKPTNSTEIWYTLSVNRLFYGIHSNMLYTKQVTVPMCLDKLSCVLSHVPRTLASKTSLWGDIPKQWEYFQEKKVINTYSCELRFKNLKMKYPVRFDWWLLGKVVHVVANLIGTNYSCFEKTVNRPEQSLLLIAERM